MKVAALNQNQNVPKWTPLEGAQYIRAGKPGSLADTLSVDNVGFWKIFFETMDVEKLRNHLKQVDGSCASGATLKDIKIDHTYLFKVGDP